MLDVSLSMPSVGVFERGIEVFCGLEVLDFQLLFYFGNSMPGDSLTPEDALLTPTALRYPFPPVRWG